VGVPGVPIMPAPAPAVKVVAAGARVGKSPGPPASWPAGR